MWISSCQTETYKSGTIERIRSCRSPHIRFSKCWICTGYCTSGYVTTRTAAWWWTAVSFITIGAVWTIGAARIAIRCCTILRCCLKLFLSFLFCFLLTLFLFFRRLLCRFLNLWIKICYFCLFWINQSCQIRLFCLIFCLHALKLWLLCLKLILQISNLLFSCNIFFQLVAIISMYTLNILSFT